MSKNFLKSGDSVIVYDDSRTSQISESFFEPAHWGDALRSSGKAGGRGAVLFVEHEGQQWVLRHYYRGGLPGKLLDDQFFWTGEANTRSFREWELLRQMYAEELPVPAPVAARYVRTGIFYRADLITELIPGVQTFSRWLGGADRPDAVWQSVGACISRFHSAGYYHADLNAHNLQIGADSTVYLLDWDRGEQRAPGAWREANLRRLHRSLRKISAKDGVEFATADWEKLLAGYHA